MTDHVLELLKKKEVPFSISGRDFVVKCLSPDHDDSSPSCRIDKVTGATHCFSCGFKCNIFKFFGIVGAQRSVKIAKLKEKLKDLYSDTNGLDMLEGAVPYTKMFRGISKKTLTKFGAFYTNIEEKLQDRLFFPVTNVRGKIQVFVGRHLMSQGNPRYLNYPSGIEMPLFPCMLETKGNSLVLVEGVFDMLNLYDKGLYNVACAFGTTTLQSNTAAKLLPFKTQGVSTIYLMFDGDEPGQTAMKKLKPVLEELEFLVETITLEEGTDPGDLDQENVDSIKAYITK